MDFSFAFLWHAPSARSRYHETVIVWIVSTQREELEEEIASLQAEDEQVAEELRLWMEMKIFE